MMNEKENNLIKWQNVVCSICTLSYLSWLFLLDRHKCQEKDTKNMWMDAIVLNGNNHYFIQKLAFSYNMKFVFFKNRIVNYNLLCIEYSKESYLKFYLRLIQF